MLSLLLLVVAVALLPIALGALAKCVAPVITWWEHRRSRRDPTGPSIERLSADLRRLQFELDRIERSDLPAKVARMRATSLAYDDVLLAACRVLEVDVGAQPPLGPLQRLETEAELARQGLLW